MKKIFLKSALALCAIAYYNGSVANAHAMPKNHRGPGGFSAALHGGYITQDNTLELKYNSGALSDNNRSSDMSGNGAFGGLTLGYDHVLQRTFILGLHVHGEASSLKGSIVNSIPFDNAKEETEVKQKHAFGAYGKLGYVSNQFTTYLKVGYINSNFDASTVARGRNTSAGTGSGSKSVSGWQVGIGVQMFITQSVFAAIEFTHAEYEKIEFKSRNNAGAELAKYTVEPKTNSIAVKVGYRF